ncbi:hypothetical protein NW762_014514 [Fusarium torreyae]|uniref:Uncharacterized protein n=1 Tax=Fusarium torreyae TaxID=1237075 RepID=A0A9W8RM66_9HYPO|nr:hypothetical protein NW762_014514 [Fusarium torreyae]
MMDLCLLLLALAACAAALPTPHEQATTFCGAPDKSDYTLVQDPFFGDKDVGQPGIKLETVYGEDRLRWFMVYQNGIDFKPYRAMKIPSNATVFIDLTTSCPTFAGRLVRGADINFDGRAHNLGTWTEVNWESYPSTYGGVSVIEGNDGPVLFQSEDPNTPTMGFVDDLIPVAPNECRVTKDSGGMTLKPTDKDGYDEATRVFTMQKLDDQKVSIDNNHTATVMSHNGRLKVTFLYGYH